MTESEEQEVNVAVVKIVTYSKTLSDKLQEEVPDRGFAAVGLFHPKTSVNVGSALRAATNYSAAMVAITGRRYGRAPTDVYASFRALPVLQVDDLRTVIPFDCVPVAVDLLPDATPLPQYKHPERAFYIFGPEDGTLGHAVTDWCRDVVFVPTVGCMNLAAAVNVVLYDRAAKRSK
jgi:tRNA(Leu) C34 or U34 (ribose-2'-O)-methylase TrmL